MQANYVISEAQPDDLPFLWDMLYEAAATEPEMRIPGKDAILALPDIRKYLEGWGRTGDLALVAFSGDERLGAAWHRLFPKEAPSYGFVAEDVPELSIAVKPEARGLGVGTALLKALFEAARAKRYRAVSLSVLRHNQARLLYERYGFQDAGISAPGDNSVTMLARLEC